MEDQGLFKQVADGLLGQIVAGGAEAPGGDEDVRPGPGRLQGLPQPLGIVSHRGVPAHVDAQGGELLRQDLGIGVGDAAQQQLGADSDDLGGVSHGDAHPLTRTQLSPARASATRASTSRAASARRTSSMSGRVAGCRGVKTVQQSS